MHPDLFEPDTPDLDELQLNTNIRADALYSAVKSVSEDTTFRRHGRAALLAEIEARTTAWEQYIRTGKFPAQY